MADSRNKPEIETLSYRAAGYKTSGELCKCADCQDNYGIGKKTIEQPASASPTTMGFNSAVIKPETRANKAEDTGQPFARESCPLKKPLKDGQQPICGDKCLEQPNKNLMMIEEIEGLMSQVNDKIYVLTTLSGDGRTTVKRTKLKGKALEEIDLFQKTTLFDLRKAFE